MEENNKLETQQVEQNEAKTFTQEEVNEMMKGMLTQDQVNDIVQKRVAKEKEKAEKERTEAERLAQLSAEERQAEELKKQREEYEAQLAEFNKIKLEFERTQLLNETTKQLSDKGLPIQMAQYVVGQDAETTKVNIDNFEKAWSEALKNAVESKLRNGNSSPTIPIVDNVAPKDPKEMSFSEFKQWKESQE